MAKKASKKKTVKRKSVTRSEQPPLDPDWEEQIPEPVADAVDEYVKAMRAKNKATAKETSAKETCIEAMREHGVGTVKIDEGKKVLRLVEEDKLKTEKIKQPKEVA